MFYGLKTGAKALKLSTICEKQKTREA